MIGFQTAFLQQLLNIAQPERISKIPADRAENERQFCLPPLEDLRSRRHFPILSRCQPGPTEFCNTTFLKALMHSFPLEQFEFITTRSGVYCLSPDPCNTLMWSHYSQNHRRICLEFG